MDPTVVTTAKRTVIILPFAGGEALDGIGWVGLISTQFKLRLSGETDTERELRASIRSSRLEGEDADSSGQRCGQSPETPCGLRSSLESWAKLSQQSAQEGTCRSLSHMDFLGMECFDPRVQRRSACGSF